jgi:hypothetical protein
LLRPRNDIRNPSSLLYTVYTISRHFAHLTHRMIMAIKPCGGLGCWGSLSLVSLRLFDPTALLLETLALFGLREFIRHMYLFYGYDVPHSLEGRHIHNIGALSSHGARFRHVLDIGSTPKPRSAVPFLGDFIVPVPPPAATPAVGKTSAHAASTGVMRERYSFLNSDWLRSILCCSLTMVQDASCSCTCS